MEGKQRETARQISEVLPIYNIDSLVSKKEVFGDFSGNNPEFLGNNPMTQFFGMVK